MKGWVVGGDVDVGVQVFRVCKKWRQTDPSPSIFFSSTQLKHFPNKKLSEQNFCLPAIHLLKHYMLNDVANYGGFDLRIYHGFILKSSLVASSDIIYHTVNLTWSTLWVIKKITMTS
jgi:hypothetical protein